MKKGLCLVLALIFVVLSTVTVSAETKPDKNMYKDVIFDYLGWEEDGVDMDYECKYAYNADGSTSEGDDVEYILGFAHRYDDPKGVMHIGEAEMYGNYVVYYPELFIPGLFVYSVKENKMYSLSEAWDEKLPNIEVVLENVGEKAALYADVFEEFLKPCGERYEQYNKSWYWIEEIYYYESLVGGTIRQKKGLPETTPDYALVRIHTRYSGPDVYVSSVCGDYLVKNKHGRPNPLEYYIYTPDDGKIYTLNEACNVGIENIDKVFTDYGLGKLMGDVDRDKNLTVMDATRIQLCLAKVKGYSLPSNEEGISDETSEYPDWTPNIADFDYNNDITVMDATAIQMKLAKL